MKSKTMLDYLARLVVLSIETPPQEVGALRYTG